MKFNKIVCVDHTKLNNRAIEELQKFSKQKIETHKDYPEIEKEKLERIGGCRNCFCFLAHKA